MLVYQRVSIILHPLNWGSARGDGWSFSVTTPHPDIHRSSKPPSCGNLHSRGYQMLLQWEVSDFFQNNWMGHLTYQLSMLLGRSWTFDLQSLAMSQGSERRHRPGTSMDLGHPHFDPEFYGSTFPLIMTYYDNIMTIFRLA